jgi:hypothetical protein
MAKPINTTAVQGVSRIKSKQGLLDLGIQTLAV